MSAAPPTEPVSPETEEAARAPRTRSPYKRILLVIGAMLIGWRLLPHVPHDQTVIFALGDGAERIRQLEVQWRAEGRDHEGRLVLNFPAPPAERVARQFRLAHGDYEFRVIAKLVPEGSDRTEATRRVTLEGNTVTLRLEELTQ